MPRGKKGDVHQISNGPTDEQALEVIEGIEAEKDKLVDLHMAYMNDCKPFHEAIKGIVDNAVKVYGMSKRTISAKVKERDHLRKAEAQREKLDDEEIEKYDKLSAQLGPLGAFAKANYENKGRRRDPLADLAGATN
jgi:plasmid replication initiation protein